MIGTEKEKQRQEALLAERRKIARQYAQVNRNTMGVPNPVYGTDPFEPSSYLPTVPSDPSLSEPLPSGRYIDPRIPSGAAVNRAADIQEFRANPDKYIEANSMELNNEQSLIDKGKTMMSRLFNYNDESDLELFNVNLSAVESTWDGFMRYFTGAYDLLSVGFGGLISAAPGGVDTLSFSQLSGGKTVGEVLSGEMEPGSAPTPGQIAITSIALEAKRIRDGEGRLSDILLANPATAPFILAALAAESSPLQQNGFNIMDDEQRNEAFSQGFEQWMSGVTDAGLMLADPLVGVGVAAKVVRAGLLGRTGSVKYGQNMKAANINALDEMDAVLPGGSGKTRLEELIQRGIQVTTPEGEPVPIIKRITQDPDFDVPLSKEILEPVVIRQSDGVPDYKNPMARFYHKLHEVDDNGNRVMTAERLAVDPSLQNLTNPSAVVDVLMKTRTPAESALVVEAMSGTPGAVERLAMLSPGLGDTVFRFKREHYTHMALTEPAKMKEVAEGFSAQIQNTQDKMRFNEEMIRKATDGQGITTDPDVFLRVQDLKKQNEILQQNLDELTEMYDVSTGKKQFDPLEPTSPFYRKDVADRIIADLISSDDAVTRAFRAEIRDSAKNAQMFFPTQSNPYSRMVMSSRERRGRARFEYAREGTSILPHKKTVIDPTTGKAIRVWDGFLSQSEFEGTNRFQRNLRVWRWMSAENPAGYIGLNGTATVGAEREFSAALDVEMYKGKQGKVITRKKYDANGDPIYVKKEGSTALVQDTEPVIVGGEARRNELFGQFYEALNNPDVDSLQALRRIEDEVIKDFAALYDLPEDKMRGVLQEAQKRGNKNLDLIKEAGYFADESGSIQHVAYIDSQLANGTYMQNFKELENILNKQLTKDNLASVRRAFEVPSHLAAGAYETFNSFWRPATLLRLSYTQRNIFEGMVRAMAYSASVAPLLWPVKATAFGIENKIIKRNIEKRVKVASKKIEGSDFNKNLQDYYAAKTNEDYVRAGLKLVQEGDSEPMRYVTRADGSVSRMTEEEWLAELDNAMNQTTDSYAIVKAKEDEFTESVKGTAFGKWREKNIADLEKTEVEVAHAIAIIQDNAMDAMEATGRSLDDKVLQDVRQLLQAQTQNKLNLDKLRFNPSEALGMYRTQAGRQRRIGSGKSMGPDGNYYGDAFTGPLVQINRDLMSADNTIIQQLSLSDSAFSSPFYKTLIRSNQAIPYSPANVDAWSKGMAHAIEEASSSWIVRSLVKNGWDEEKVLAEMLTTDEGQRFVIRLAGLMGDADLKDVASTVDDAFIGPVGADGLVKTSERTALRRFAETYEQAGRTPSGKKMTGVTNGEQAIVYINETANMVKRQMQSRQEFMDLLTRRVNEKMDKSVVSAGGITADEVKDALNLIPEAQRDNLKYIMGSQIIQMGADGPLGAWAKLASKAFQYLGRMPEDAITRGGFYNMRFKAARNTLIETYLETSGQRSALRGRRNARSATNRSEGMTLEHGEVGIPANEWSRIEVEAHRVALKDTREWMYTIERRTNVGKYGEWIFPFISASQNSLTVAGKLLYKEPWLAPMIVNLWRMPERLGVEDENGNVLLPMPLDWVQKKLQDNPNIPVIGGVLDSSDVLRFPKDGLNVWIPESGFGVLPRPTPWVQVGASELMKAGAFPIETPQVIRSVMGQEQGDEFYKTLKDYVFGEEQGASDKFMSWDKLLPAYAQKAIYSRDELSTQYGYQYSLHWHTQTMRFRAGERDTPPTEDEIAKRTTNSFWFGLFGNQGIPTPLTPYPILTRPAVDSPITGLQEVYQTLQEADPLTANMNMDRMFGDWGFEAALTKVTQNVGGANPTAETVSDIDTLSPLIRSLSADLGPSDLSVLGILVNNRRAPSAYEQSAYNWQKSAKIPGTNREWREVQSPEEAVAERQRLTGWTLYRQAIDQLDAQMYSAGLSSYELKAAAPYKAAKERLVANLMSNPDYEGWIVDYQDQGGSKTLSAVRVLEGATQDDTFRKLLISSGKEQLLSIMDQYVTTRRLLNTVLEQSGHSINHESNLEWKVGWDAMRLKWRNQDERWAEIDSLYLSGDENPQAPGNLYLQNLATEEMQGVG